MNAPTLKDIAKIANVSITTVSKALADHPDISEATKARIKKICAEVQYVPNAIASNLRKNRTKFIGVVISDTANPYFANFLKKVEEDLSKNNYYTIIFNTNEDEDREIKYIKELRSMNVAGFIITPTCYESVKLLREYGTPFVLASRYTSKDEDNYVVPDDEQAGFLATKRILQDGTHGPVFFLGPKLSISSFQDRLNGYFRALSEYNIEINMGNVHMNAYNNEDGYTITKSIINKMEPPYSFVCESDFVAIGVLKALYENGIAVPEQAKVTGIDNIDVFTFAQPTLTTVDTQKEKIGSVCVEILLDIIRNKKKGEKPEDKRVVFPVELVDNGTC